MRDPEFMLGALLGLALIAFLAFAMYACVDESNEWETFKVEHKCKVTGKMRGEMFNTFDMKGNVGIGSTSSKVAWTCDDGITYWR